MVRGMLRLVVFNSAPAAVLSVGTSLHGLRPVRPTMFRNEVNGARWLEAVVSDHGTSLRLLPMNRRVCPGDPSKTAPRIGAARSRNGGLSWTDLGIIIDTARVAPDCETPNRYFAGGVGDFSVILNRSETDLYILFSTYDPAIEHQGVPIGRMRWSDRNEPQGNVAIWSRQSWRYPTADPEGWIFPAASPILRAAVSWHSRSRDVDAFWGPRCTGTPSWSAM